MEKESLKFAIQIRAARSILFWSQQELSDAAGVTRLTIARIEALSLQPRMQTVGKIKSALAIAGLKMFDGQPSGGFSVIVSKEVIETIFETHQKLNGSKTNQSETKKRIKSNLKDSSLILEILI
jgi:DNA-binding XRE family transcriptional regulator